jgi:hypothetical protein
MDENDYVDSEDRRALLFLWQELDLEQIAIDNERIAEALQEMKKK